MVGMRDLQQAAIFLDHAADQSLFPRRQQFFEVGSGRVEKDQRQLAGRVGGHHLVGRAAIVAGLMTGHPHADGGEAARLRLNDFWLIATVDDADRQQKSQVAHPLARHLLD